MPKHTNRRLNLADPTIRKTETAAEAAGRAALRPEINTLLVVDAFKGGFVGEDADLSLVMRHLEKSVQDINSGDLTHLESMLLAQATTLQTLFTCFTTRAAKQQHLPNYQAFMGMALKAQAQSRSTIQTLVDLKSPKHPTFVKQANISQGPQQINNGNTEPFTTSRVEHPSTVKIKLKERNHEQAKTIGVDTRAPRAPSRTDPAMETMGKVNRTQKRQG
jgi:hypothetical protein